MEQLELSLKSMSAIERENIHLVQADPGRLPFGDLSVEGIVALPFEKSKTDPASKSGEQPSPMTEEFTRTLTDTGQLVEIVRSSDDQITTQGRYSGRFPEKRSYYVRPATGDHYFVTGQWLPSPWPFRSLHHGRLRSLYIGLDLVASRMRLRPFYNSVQLLLHSKCGGRRIVEQLVDRTGRSEAEESDHWKELRLFVKADWNAILLGNEGSNVIVKFPLSYGTLTSMEEHLETLSTLTVGENLALRDLLPQFVEQGVTYGQTHWSEVRIDGIPAAKLRWKRGWRRKVAELGSDFLTELHKSTRQPTRITQDRFVQLVGVHAVAVENAVRRFDPAFNMGPIMDSLWHSFRKREIPLVRTHGDFWPANLLVSDEGKLAGVLDWDRSQKSGWPLLDLLHWITFQQKWRAIWHFGSMVTGRILPARFTMWERAMVEKYCATMGIDDDLWPAFVTLFWLYRLSQAASIFDEKWLKRNAIIPLPHIHKALSGV
jgi:hypothetical protein